MRSLLTPLCCLLLAGCASQPKVYQGEHLVLPFIDELRQWQLFQTEDDKGRANMWQKPPHRWQDTYAVSILYGLSQDLSNQRSIMDEPGRQQCDEFESVQLAHPKHHDQSSLYWQTQCLVDGEVAARILHLMIQGEQSAYQIQKIWKFDPSTEQQELWRQRFDNTYVCNTTSSDRPCPTD